MLSMLFPICIQKYKEKKTRFILISRYYSLLTAIKHSKNIPFLGICFSHQLFAWIYGARVDFVEERENLPEKKYNEFRKIKVLDSKLKSIIDTNEFISKAKHEQEVKNIPNEHLELTITSEHCKIEGLTHKIYPAFSIQTHPEEFHESKQGWIFMKKFIGYFISNSIATDDTK